VVDLAFLDDEGAAVHLDAAEAASLLTVTDGLDAATTSACPGCRSRVVSAVALVDLLAGSAPHARGGELVDLADEAPTLHLYVVDAASRCRHRSWRDPGGEEWREATASRQPSRRRP